MLPLPPPQAQYNARTEAISDRNSELHRITEQLAEMKAIMDSYSTNIADATPVEQCKGPGLDVLALAILGSLSTKHAADTPFVIQSPCCLSQTHWGFGWIPVWDRKQ
eukprot:308448-Pelagomonas_calceolata.AAC.2